VNLGASGQHGALSAMIRPFGDRKRLVPRDLIVDTFETAITWDPRLPARAGALERGERQRSTACGMPHRSWPA
jgi:hypothetical protein